MPTLITLLTDFGTDDTYVGQMKGVIAGICPTAAVIDLTHAVRPQQVEQGAFLLETATAQMPSGAVHVAVVDPGVGTARRGLAIRAQRDGVDTYLVGPDNGLLSCVVPLEGRPDTVGFVRLPDGIEAVALDRPDERPVSPTFHGRDVFAVAAARLACGASIIDLGVRVAEMIALPAFLAAHDRPGLLRGRVVHIDRFGNAITTVYAAQLTASPQEVRIGDVRVDAFVRTYGDGSGLVALIGSSGYLEVAWVNGDAAARLGIQIGWDVWVRTDD